MVGLGIVLMLIGFVLIIPRGAMAGSIAARNVRMSPGQLSRTPGYQEAPTGRARLVRFAVGAVLMVAGLLVIIAAG